MISAIVEAEATKGGRFSIDSGGMVAAVENIELAPIDNRLLGNPGLEGRSVERGRDVVSSGLETELVNRSGVNGLAMDNVSGFWDT
jgi:hypothetical protein